MNKKNLLKLVVAGLTAGLLMSAQSAQTNKDVPAKETTAGNDTVLPTATASDENQEVAMMKCSKEPVADMQKSETKSMKSDSCNKPAKCEPCNKPKCESCKPKCEPCSKPKTECPKAAKPDNCGKCEKSCGCPEPTPPKKSKGAAQEAVEG
jgi:hypothetical protein